ncbi:hypothetical protein Q9S36_18300 [Microbacterium sp. ARD31]|uniref:hypothetical protein n=1 Tax=Microbacterium sp. ARD31 TaxID=2962576 RepID=UPI0028823708|nr:hypothetical protein [Microbacterium sp. ARD31]MDT0182130.1 hypothetical protein [Microbacterium sp. ARD31]
MNDSHADRPSHSDDQDDTTVEDDSAASAGSESPEEGQAAMDAAEDAAINSDGN